MSSNIQKKKSGHLKHIVFASAILIVLAVAQESIIKALGFVMVKSDVPLSHPIVEFTDMVSPRFVLAREINANGVKNGKAVLTADVEKTLGTEDYISWIFRDTKLSKSGRFVGVRFHLAYYTGLLDAVPHVPDNCMIAGGMTADRENTGQSNWQLTGLDQKWSDWSELELKRSSFKDARKAGSRPLVVYYVFSVNGKPMWDRNKIRLALANPYKKYVYYMKIELSAFASDGLTPQESEDICHAFMQDASDEIFAMIADAGTIEQMEADDKQADGESGE